MTPRVPSREGSRKPRALPGCDLFHSSALLCGVSPTTADIPTLLQGTTNEVKRA